MSAKLAIMQFAYINHKELLCKTSSKKSTLWNGNINKASWNGNITKLFLSTFGNEARSICRLILVNSI